MTDDTQIRYVFHNEDGETATMTFNILQIEGMTGGFINYVNKQLKEMNFGKVAEIYRTLLL